MLWATLHLGNYLNMCAVDLTKEHVVWPLWLDKALVNHFLWHQYSEKFKICNYWYYLILPSDTHFNITYIFMWLYQPLREIIGISHNANLHRIKNSILPFLWTFLLQSMIPVIFGHIPAGASTKTFIHYGQLVTSGKKFCCFWTTRVMT
jgi:hypothetical protein